MLKIRTNPFAAQRPQFFHARDDAGGGATSSSPSPSTQPRPPPVDAPGSLGPSSVQPHPDATEQMRRQARQASRHLADRAAERAAELSRTTGRHVDADKTPTEDEILEGLQSGDTSALDTPAHLTAGPNPGTVGLRPGESPTGPATGPLARGRLVPEHDIIGGKTIPTINAPGLGADTGAKKTDDNPDARAGAGGHAEGVDPADPAFRGQVAEERHDTAADTAARVAAEADIHAAVTAGKMPTREQFLAAGVPDNQLDNAMTAAQDEIDRQKAYQAEKEKAGTAALPEKDGEKAPEKAPASELDAQALIDGNTKDQLLELADKEGVPDVKPGDTKETIANAIVAKRSQK